MTDKLFPGKFLFVGGPADGKFITCNSPYISIPDFPKVQCIIWNRDDIDLCNRQFNRVEYKCMHFRGNSKIFHVFVPEGTSADSVIEQLIKGYKS